MRTIILLAVGALASGAALAWPDIHESATDPDDDLSRDAADSDAFAPTGLARCPTGAKPTPHAAAEAAPPRVLLRVEGPTAEESSDVAVTYVPTCEPERTVPRGIDDRFTVELVVAETKSAGWVHVRHEAFVPETLWLGSGDEATRGGDCERTVVLHRATFVRGLARTETGEPVVDAGPILLDPSGSHERVGARTDADGRYVAPLPFREGEVPAVVDLAIDVPGYRLGVTRVELRPQKTVEAPDIVLERGLTLRGTLLTEPNSGRKPWNVVWARIPGTPEQRWDRNYARVGERWERTLTDVEVNFETATTFELTGLSPGRVIVEPAQCYTCGLAYTSVHPDVDAQCMKIVEIPSDDVTLDVRGWRCCIDVVDEQDASVDAHVWIDGERGRLRLDTGEHKRGVAWLPARSMRAHVMASGFESRALDLRQGDDDRSPSIVLRRGSDASVDARLSEPASPRFLFRIAGGPHSPSSVPCRVLTPDGRPVEAWFGWRGYDSFTELGREVPVGELLEAGFAADVNDVVLEAGDDNSGCGRVEVDCTQCDVEHSDTAVRVVLPTR